MLLFDGLGFIKLFAQQNIPTPQAHTQPTFPHTCFCPLASDSQLPGAAKIKSYLYDSPTTQYNSARAGE